MFNPERIYKEIIKYIFPKEDILFNYRPDWLKNPQTNRNLELDIYIPRLKLAYEIQGIQHKLNYQKKKDDVKRKICFEKGINLIEIWGLERLKRFLRIRKKIPLSLKIKILDTISHYESLEFKNTTWYKKIKNRIIRQQIIQSRNNKIKRIFGEEKDGILKRRAIKEKIVQFRLVPIN